ncbi:MAG: DUF6760 family protein [bacterium]|nr:DUF6760 family protein [bacterium]
MSYPSERLHEEVAFLSIGLGWSRESILALTHPERHAWIRQVNQMNRRLNRT